MILIVTARRRREPDPGPPADPSAPEPVDHERLLAEALGARPARAGGVLDGDQRPAWLRRLEPTAGRPVFHEPDVDDTI